MKVIGVISASGHGETDIADEGAQERTPSHVNQSHKNRPVLDGGQVDQIIGRIGHQSKEGGQHQVLCSEPDCCPGMITKTSSPMLNSR